MGYLVGGGNPLKLLSRGVIHNLHFYKTGLSARWEIGRQGKHLGKSAGRLSKRDGPWTRIYRGDAAEKQRVSG